MFPGIFNFQGIWIRKTSKQLVLTNLLDSLHFCFFTDICTLSSDPSSSYICKSWFYFVVKNHSKSVSTFFQFFLEGKGSSKVKFFICAAILQRINTNDRIQVCRPHKLWLQFVCVTRTQFNGHLFLHCDIACKLWTKLFSLFDVIWDGPLNLGCLSFSFSIFGDNKS